MSFKSTSDSYRTPTPQAFKQANDKCQFYQHSSNKKAQVSLIDNKSLMGKLKYMQGQLDQLIQMVDHRQHKQELADQRIRDIGVYQEKQRDIVQRQMIEQNEQMIRILEKKQLEIENAACLEKNLGEVQQLQKMRRKLEIAEEKVGFQRLKNQQVRRQNAWKAAETRRVQENKIRSRNLQGEIVDIRRRIRKEIGTQDLNSSTESSESSSFYLQMNSANPRPVVKPRINTPHIQHWACPNQIEDNLQAIMHRSGKSAPSITDIQQMPALLSPLCLDLDIKESRKYPFSRETSVILCNPYY